ncbi:RND transporter, partial [Rhodococcus sp. NPDC059234]
MKLLGDDCWWAPAWMKRIQERLGLGEPILDDERMPENVPEIAAVGIALAPVAPVAARASNPLTRDAIERVLPPRTAAASRIAETVEPLVGEPLTEPIPMMGSNPVVSPPRPEPAPSTPQARVPAPRVAESTPSAQDRPIESWLQDLRMPARERANVAVPTGQHGAPAQNGLSQNGHGGVPNGSPQPAAAPSRQVLPPRPVPPQARPAATAPMPAPAPRAAAPVPPPAPPRVAPAPAPAAPAPTPTRETDESAIEPGRHRHTEGAPTVSVSELLARQKRE